MLPHRYPFLMVDRVIDMHGDEQRHRHQERDLQRAALPWGTFPDNPVFPGRADDRRHGADRRRALHRAICASTRPKSVFFLTIDKAKFRKPVLPGDTIEYHMNKIARRRNMWWYRGEAKVAGQHRRRGGSRRHDCPTHERAP